MADDPAKPQEELEEEEADLSHKDATNDYELPDSLPYACSIEYPGVSPSLSFVSAHLLLLPAYRCMSDDVCE